jgi:hypothetical protein
MHDDVNIRALAIFLGILTATVAAFYVLLGLMWRGLEHDAQHTDQQILREAPVTASGQPFFPFPREQPNPVEDLNALRAREQAELTRYGWINRTSGIVRIPIERAIDLLSQPPGGRP